jgi:DNA-binding transcriptional LysR family regulator
MDIEDLRLLELTARLGSFTKAANASGISKSVLSRRIRLLEEDFDSRLLHRTTRHVKLTEAGEQTLQVAEPMLKQYDELKQQLGQSRNVPTGKLRIAAPLEFERVYLRGFLIQYLNDYPELDFQLTSTNQSLDMLHKELADVAIHFGTPPDSSYIARKLGEVKVNYYASPDYLKRQGTPKTLEDLQRHDCIIEQYRDQSNRQWLFHENGKIHTVLVNDRYSSNTTELCIHFAEQGLGIVWLPEFLCKDLLGNGKLVNIFEGRYQQSSPVYALYASREFLPTKIKTFVETLIQHFPDHM